MVLHMCCISYHQSSILSFYRLQRGFADWILMMKPVSCCTVNTMPTSKSSKPWLLCERRTPSRPLRHMQRCQRQSGGSEERSSRSAPWRLWHQCLPSNTRPWMDIGPRAWSQQIQIEDQIHCHRKLQSINLQTNVRFVWRDFLLLVTCLELAASATTIFIRPACQSGPRKSSKLNGSRNLGCYPRNSNLAPVPAAVPPKDMTGPDDGRNRQSRALNLLQVTALTGMALASAKQTLNRKPRVNNLLSKIKYNHAESAIQMSRDPT